MAQDSLLSPDPETVEAAQHALWYNGDRDLGVDPGTFVYRLFRAYVAADPENRTKLQVAFPATLEPFRIGMFTVDGVEELRRLVKEAHDLRAASDFPGEDTYRIEDTCCGRCPGASCYVDQITGA